MRRRNILVRGAGSIGGRHARNLVEAGADVVVTDPDETVGWDIEGAARIPFSPSIPSGFDGIVVASPTAQHLRDAEAALGTGAHVLVEKPLSVSTEGTAELLSAADNRLMVGYNLRCHPDVCHAVELIRSGAVGEVLHARLWFGHYLPNWRGTKDYRQTYSARVDQGGGILLDATHELDLLVWMFGNDFLVENALIRRTGVLDIETEDYVQATLRHESGIIVEVSLDYLSQRKRRGIEVIGTTNTLRLDWARATLELENRSAIKKLADVRPATDSYVLEASAFLAWIDGKRHAPVDGSEGVLSLELAEKIKSAAEER